MNECQHRNRKYSSREILTSKPPKRPWVCPDCGAKGSDQILERRAPKTATIVKRVIR